MFGSNQDKPSAMEAMVAKMLGFTPDQMQETITSFRNTIVAVADALKRIEDKQEQILAKLEAQEHEQRNGNSRGGKRATLPAPSGGAGTGGGSGDASGSPAS